MTEKVVKTSGGAILYDPSVIREIRESYFRPDGWLHAEPVDGEAGSGGRGNTCFVGNVPRQFVLRHYLRGQTSLYRLEVEDVEVEDVEVEAVEVEDVEGGTK